MTKYPETTEDNEFLLFLLRWSRDKIENNLDFNPSRNTNAERLALAFANAEIAGRSLTPSG